jgi:hypothetical protein
MSAARSLYRLAVLGLLLSRAPRSVQRIVGWMLFGVALAVVVIILATAAHGEDAPRYWPSYQSGRSVIVPPPPWPRTCPLDRAGCALMRAARPTATAPLVERTFVLVVLPVVVVGAPHD